jgi:hypothetical protein
LRIKKRDIPLYPQSQEIVNKQAKVAQLVEHDLAKVGVASSNLVFRSLKALVIEGFVV